MHLAVAYLTGSSNGWYRALLPMLEAERRGHRIVWDMGQALQAGQRGEPRYDLIHIHQFISDGDLAMMRRLRERGVAVVWDTDDDIMGTPKFSPTYKEIGGKRKLKKRFALASEIARTAHLVTTSSARLADTYRDAGAANVAVIENQLRPGDVGRARRRARGVTIGLAAAMEHETDLRALQLAETLRAMLERNPRVRLVTIGIHLGFDHPRYAYRPWVPIERLIETESDFDVGLAPLVDTPFNRARSNVKLKEYAAAGAAWLASPTGPYAGLGERQGGLLVDDDGWPQALERIVDDDALRRGLAQRGRAWAAKQTITQSGAIWENAFRDAILRARAERGAAVASR